MLVSVQFVLNIIRVHDHSTSVYDIAAEFSGGYWHGGLEICPGRRDIDRGGGVNFACDWGGHICSVVGRLPSYRVGKFGLPELGTRDIISGPGVCGVHSGGIAP